MLTENFAKIISIVFHPLLLPTYLFITIFYLAPEAISHINAFQIANNQHITNIDFKFNLLIFLFLGTFLIPASVIYYMYKLKLLPSISMEARRSRQLPYLIICIIYFAFAMLLQVRLPQLFEIYICILTISLSILSVFIINFFWKISAHAVGIFGIIGTLVSFVTKKEIDQLFVPMIFSLILAGIICAARLKLNAHTLAQILGGAILGLLVSISSFLLFL